MQRLGMAFFVYSLNREAACVILTLFGLFFPIFSIVSLFIIVGETFERFVAVVHAFYYRTDLTRTKLRIFVLVSWLYALSWISVIFLEGKYAKVYVV